MNYREYSLYLNRKDVKAAIHAPDVKWAECAYDNVFVLYDLSPIALGEDKSLDPIQGALPQVIEATNRVLISHGTWDSVLMSNATLLSIQNMTWNGQLGFQEAPSQDFIVPIPHQGPSVWRGPQGVMGRQHYERGLQWVETFQAGRRMIVYLCSITDFLVGHGNTSVH